MNGRVAGLLFLGICVVLAILLMLSAITPLVSSSVFAAALLIVGWLSRGFRRT